MPPVVATFTVRVTRPPPLAFAGGRGLFEVAQPRFPRGLAVHPGMQNGSHLGVGHLQPVDKNDEGGGRG